MGRQHHLHWTSLRLAAALCAGVSTAALLPTVASADEALVIARQLDINSLDPARGFCDTCQIYFSNVYETLIGLGKDNATLTPRLATKWESNGDQSQFTFHLDPDAKFSDGSPVEAKDVVSAALESRGALPSDNASTAASKAAREIERAREKAAEAEAEAEDNNTQQEAERLRALTANIAANDPYLASRVIRAWLREVAQAEPTAPTSGSSEAA